MYDFNKAQINSLNKLFEDFNSNNINYCILRNFENIPENIGNDIDFLVDEKQFKRIDLILDTVMNQFDFTLLITKNRFGYVGKYYIHTKTNNILLLDFFTKSSKKWLEYADVAYILKHKVQFKNFYVPRQGSILYTVLLKDLLTYSQLRNKNNDLLTHMGDEVKKEFIETGSKYFDKKILLNLFDSLKNDKVLYSKQYLFNNLKTYNNITNTIKYTYYRTKEVIQNLLFNKMYFISIIGPDGVGKSTVTSNLKNGLRDKGLFKDTLDIHHRFEFIPNISAIFTKKPKEDDIHSNSEIESSVVTNPTKKHSWFRTLIYVIYYSIDFILGYIYILKYKATGGIIIADRYYYDFYIQKHYDNLPDFIKRFFYALIPQPNIIFFLSADANTIYKRKYELTLEETIDQNERCKNIIQYHNGILIDANNDAQTVNNHIKDAIYKRMLHE